MPYPASSFIYISSHDYTAGSLIVSEAGGIVTTLDQTEIVYHKPVSLIAGGREAYHDIFRIYP